MNAAKPGLGRREFLKASAAGLAGLVATTNPSFAAPTTREKPGMKVILWCWDARMTWDDQPEAIAHQMAGAARPFPYLKRPEAFLVGFKRLVDYAAKIGVHGLIVWGFLRDGHGGVAAAKELCQYASDNGVAILPGVGLCSYGGYYFDGDHRFNLASYLRKHPDRACTIPPARPGARETGPVLDPSLKANQQWWRDGLEWMLETFRVGGIDFEMGDFLVCPTPQARAARAALGFDTDESTQDIVVATRDLIPQAIREFPKGIFINSLYRGCHQIKGFPKTPYVSALPGETVWQYTLTHMANRSEFPDGYAGASEHRRHGYLHWFNSSTKTMEKDYAPLIARVFPGVRKLGFEFIGTYGEVSAIGNLLADQNYRAQVTWAAGPKRAAAGF